MVIFARLGLGCPSLTRVWTRQPQFSPAGDSRENRACLFLLLGFAAVKCHRALV